MALEKKTNRSRDQRKATPTESPRSLDTGNSYAEEMYPFMALLQGRRHSRIEDPDPSRTLQPTGEAAASASGPPETTVSDAGVVAERPTSAAPGELRDLTSCSMCLRVQSTCLRDVGASVKVRRQAMYSVVSKVLTQSNNPNYTAYGGCLAAEDMVRLRCPIPHSFRTNWRRV